MEDDVPSCQVLQDRNFSFINQQDVQKLSSDQCNISSNCSQDGDISYYSSINQLDGADTSSETSGSPSGSDDEYDGDEEAYSAPVRAVLVPAPGLPGEPPGLVVDTSGGDGAPSCLPLELHGAGGGV